MADRQIYVGDGVLHEEGEEEYYVGDGVYNEDQAVTGLTVPQIILMRREAQPPTPLLQR